VKGVGPDAGDLSAQAGDGVIQFCLTTSGDIYLRALSGQLFSGCQTDTAGTTGDESDFTC